MSKSEKFELTCGVIFHIFWPPFPKQVAGKVVFRPPSPPYYELRLSHSGRNDCDIKLTHDAGARWNNLILKQQCRYVTASNGNKIAVLYVNCNREKKFTIIYSHGNAEDLGLIYTPCVQLSAILECDVVAYDYSGYGQSKGTSSEENIYADIEAVWEYTLTFHEHRPENIIVYGKSLGTCPSIDIASKVSCAGVVLVSCFTSGLDAAFPKRRLKCNFFDQFRK